MAAGDHRVAMLQLALMGTGFSVLMDELQRDPPSYMIDTVQGLLQKEQADYYLLLGTDILKDIEKWKSYKELMQVARPLIACRKASDLLYCSKIEDLSIRCIIEKGITETPLFDISSTMVRERLKNKLFCGHLLDNEVLNYIKQYGLYERT